MHPWYRSRMEEFPGTEPAEAEGTEESIEEASFKVEKIRTLLALIDGVERPNLAVTERNENSKGELMSLCFSTGEKEVVDGAELEVTYQLTVAGQRYNAEGALGRVVEQTFLTKDYDEGMSGSERLAVYTGGGWKAVGRKNESEDEVALKKHEKHRASLMHALGYEVLLNDGKWLTVTKDGYRIQMMHFVGPSEFGIDNGRISAIEIRKDAHSAVLWDRGPTDEKVWDEGSERIYEELVSTLNPTVLQEETPSPAPVQETESAPAPEEGPLSPEQWAGEVKEFEKLCAKFERKHDLDALNAIQVHTIEEARANEVRQAALKDLPPLVTLRNRIIEQDQIPQDIKSRINARYKAIQAAVGALNNGRLDHSIRW